MSGEDIFPTNEGFSSTTRRKSVALSEDSQASPDLASQLKSPRRHSRVPHGLPRAPPGIPEDLFSDMLDDRRSSTRISIGGLARRLSKMGKKEARAKTDKSASSGHHGESADDGNKSPEPHVCTGKFQDDFNELCLRANLYTTPGIVHRARRPGTPPPPVEAKPEKGGKEKGKKGAEPVVAPPPEPETLTEDGEPPEPPPKTYVTKDRFEYFKPGVQVEMDHPDKQDTVTEVFVRGWKVDDTMMNIFRQCWASMEKLHSINLWSAGLTEESISLLGSFLPNCVNVKNLLIEGNTPVIKAENYHVLLTEESLLTNISLRHNGITDLGVKNICNVLGGYKNPNTKLISLNLTGNKIGDDGAKSIASALRMNRTLLSLTLAQNHISDIGAKELAQTIKCFPLSHEEVVERRKLKSEKGGGSDGGKSPPPSRRADSKDRPGSHRSSSHLGKDKRDKSSKKKDDKPDAKEKTKGGKGKEAEKTQPGKKDGTKGGKVMKMAAFAMMANVIDGAFLLSASHSPQRGATSRLSLDLGPEATAFRIPKRSARRASYALAAAADTKAQTKGGKTTKGGKGAGKGPTPNEPEPEASDILNPLLEAAESIENNLWIPGNRILINLNLQRNKIGEDGINAFKLAIQYQDTILNESPKNQGTGLMRLIINRNLLDANNPEMKKLTDMMMRRDPFYKAPATPDPDADAEKTR